MCNASNYARMTRKAQVDEVLGVGGLGSYGIGAFHPLGQTTKDCVICIENGARLALADIPAKARAVYGLGYVENVTFVETPGPQISILHDLVLFDGHPELGAVPLLHLAGDGTRAHVRTIEGTDEIVDAIMKRAIQPAPVNTTPTLDDLLALQKQSEHAGEV